MLMPEKFSVADLEKLAKAAKTVRSQYESEWLLNIAYFQGDQWVNVVRGAIKKPSVPAYVNLVTDNRILPAVVTRLARMTKQKPKWTATPATAEDDAVDSAQTAERALDFRWTEDHLEAKHASALLWANVTCAGFWKVTWDKTLGEGFDVIVDENGQPVKQASGRMMRPEDLGGVLPPGLEAKRVNQGDVRVDVRTPFQLLPDPLAERMDDAEWIIEEVVQPTGYVQTHYGKRLEGDTAASPGLVETGRFLNRSSDYKGVKVSEFWLRPCAAHPKGKHIVWAKNEILLEEDNPYDCLPYVMFSGERVPSRFWPTCVTSQLRPLNTDLNKLKSQIHANISRFGNLSMLMPRSADVQYSGIPGEQIRYNDVMPNSVPAFLAPPSIPPYVVNEIDRIEAAMREVSGQHEVVGGNVPAGVTAASAINLLLEQDDTRLGPAIYEDERSLSESGQMILNLMSERYTEERYLRFVGPDNDVDVLTIQGSSLKGAHRIQVQAGSTAPTSKAAKQAAMTQILTLLVQNGQVPDNYAMERFLRDYQVGGLEHLFADSTEDVRQVNREHRRLYRGERVPINDFDNDQFHIQAHEDRQKSASYERLGDAEKMVVQEHIQAHRDRFAQAQAAMAQANPALPPGPAPGMVDLATPPAAPPQLEAGSRNGSGG